MNERQLPGGRTVGAVRIGDTVRKPAQRWSATVQALLHHLEKAGFDGAPRALGFDEQGREMLSYLPGETILDRGWPELVFTDGALSEVGRWARRLHDTTATFVPPDDATWFTGRPWQPGLIIGHHDAAPWNAVWAGGRLTGFVDWDTAGPSDREFELAYMALTWVPLFAPEFAATLEFTTPQDRSRRFHLLLDAYGYEGDREAFPALIARQARIRTEVIHRMLARNEPMHETMPGWARDLENAAREVESLPAEFWTG